MTSAAPTVLALQMDSAWVVIVAVSAVTLPVCLLLRRLIRSSGGLASGILLGLPLALPIVMALLYGHPVLPEIAVLRPAISAVFETSGRHLQHLLVLRDASGRVVVPYALAASTGPWLLLVGGATTSLMLLRRGLGAFAMRRLVRRCTPPSGPTAVQLGEMTTRLSNRAGLTEHPQLLLLPPGVSGAFATGGSRSRILLSTDLLECLEERELEAAIAHEIAHLQARDVPLMVVAGVLRDLVAWNPVAHVAFRRLTLDRELEADRRAAALTGKPLAVASSLLKMCELLRSNKNHAFRPAIGFGRRRGKVCRRVSSLIAVADGKVTVSGSSSRAPFVAAAMLAAVLALQVGARMTESNNAALAFVWGAPSSTSSEIWRPGPDPRGLKKARDGAAVRPEGSGSKTAQPLPPRSALAALRAAPAVKEKNLGRWMKALNSVAERRGTPPTSSLLRAEDGWRGAPVFSPRALGAFGIYRVEKLEWPLSAGG